jgi:biotin transporter BioY
MRFTHGELAMQQPNIIKTTGYLVSILSVVLLGVVSWKAAQQSLMLMACLLGGMLCSVLGMAMRWLSYQIDK